METLQVAQRTNAKAAASRVGVVVKLLKRIGQVENRTAAVSYLQAGLLILAADGHLPVMSGCHLHERW
jgi:hypothetical protein